MAAKWALRFGAFVSLPGNCNMASNTGEIRHGKVVCCTAEIGGGPPPFSCAALPDRSRVHAGPNQKVGKQRADVGSPAFAQATAWQAAVRQAQALTGRQKSEIEGQTRAEVIFAGGAVGICDE
jgi:hypothetical protein